MSVAANSGAPAPPLNVRVEPSSVTGAIRRAAAATGASFEYLLAAARIESSFKPNAVAKTSSATGLFQFIEQTWLGVIKQAGEMLGLARYADAVTRSPSGRFHVSDPALRDEILELRKDPAASAAVAGIFTQQNASALAHRIGRDPTEGELYIAHFFGSAGAARLINAAESAPRSNAAAMFPAAARANRSIFYDHQGGPRTAGQVYTELNRRFLAARTRTFPAVTDIAARDPAMLKANDTAGTVLAFAAGAEPAAPAPAKRQLAFKSLFLETDTRGPVSAVVAELWRGPATREGVGSGAPLDLFQEVQPEAGELFKRSA
jgi:hypothetical protein